MASTQKYASLPDIDSAPDIYETPDAFPNSHENEEHSDDDGYESRAGRRNIDETTTREDLDRSHLPDRNQVGTKFRKAEKRRGRFREVYAYPTSPNSSPSRSPSPGGSSRKPTPLNVRLQALRKELDSLEKEVSDPSNPLLSAPGQDADPGAMMRGLVEIRERLGQIGIGDSRGTGHALVTRVLESTKSSSSATGAADGPQEEQAEPLKAKEILKKPSQESEGDHIAHLDHRLGELESLIGASNASLDESSPLPQPLLPHIKRLSNLLTLLTQPRHIDSVSRRLKLLLTDLERYSATSGHRQSSAPGHASAAAGGRSNSPAPSQPQSPPLHDLAPVLNRLAPALPTIPHLLGRLRTLATLHASASGFATSLNGLEEEQKQTRVGLTELSLAVDGLEKSLEVNAERVETNLKGLLERLEAVQDRLQAAGR